MSKILWKIVQRDTRLMFSVAHSYLEMLTFQVKLLKLKDVVQSSIDFDC